MAGKTMDQAAASTKKPTEAPAPDEAEKLGAEALEALGGGDTPPRSDKTPEEAKQLSREERKAKLAQMLDRGLVNDRLRVKHLLPKGRHPVFVRNRHEDISLYEAMGYRVEKFSKDVIAKELGEGAHDSGDGTYRIGDVILMSCDQETYEILEELQQERTRKKLTQPRQELKAAMREVEGAGVSLFEG